MLRERSHARERPRSLVGLRVRTASAASLQTGAGPRLSAGPRIATCAGLYAGFCPRRRPSPPAAGGPPSIWDRRRRRPRAAYPRPRAGNPFRPRRAPRTLCGLAPRGVCLAATVASRAGGLLPHRFTHHLCGRSRPRHRLACSLLHVPSLGPKPGRLPVRKHGALRCPDVPPRREARRRPGRRVPNVQANGGASRAPRPETGGRRRAASATGPRARSPGQRSPAPAERARARRARAPVQAERRRPPPPRPRAGRLRGATARRRGRSGA